MSNDFSGLQAAIDNVVAVIQEAVTELSNPANDQATIDAATAKLTDAAAALAAVEVPAPAPAPAPDEEPAPSDTPSA